MRDYHILDCAATLLGVALVIVTAVHITGKAPQGLADELSFVAALVFLGSCAASHRSVNRSDDRLEQIGDRLFATGLLLLLSGVLSLWF